MPLILVPTPIGNLKDITLRALEVLRTADYILCEDTRKSSILLSHYQIEKPLIAFHAHNEHRTQGRVLSLLALGNTLALLTDAGTPSISDPGFLLVRSALEKALPVECLPGPTAFLPALAGSGLPTHHFTFLGFPPVKKGRKHFFTQLSAITHTFILYEASHRIIATLHCLSEYLPQHTFVVAKEISKIHEKFYRGKAEQIIYKIEKDGVRGEFVILGALLKQQKEKQ